MAADEEYHAKKADMEELQRMLRQRQIELSKVSRAENLKLRDLTKKYNKEQVPKYMSGWPREAFLFCLSRRLWLREARHRRRCELRRCEDEC